VARLGRPTALRGVYSFEDPLLVAPPEVTVDTSFAVNVLVPREQHHRESRAFADQLATAGATLVFNRLLELELREAAFRIALKERYPKDWRHRRHDGRSLARAGRLAADAFESWQELTSGFDVLLIELHEVEDRIGELMNRFGLASYDAVHAATAEFAGAPVVVTTDVDFARVPADRLTIYTNAGRVGSCRRIRS
jgi:predicted nucleic acid-binding protein